MLLGEFRHTLDSKGRVFVPSKWREELGEGVVISKGLESCLYVMTPNHFTAYSDRLSARALENQPAREYARMLYSGSQEEHIDKQGRVTVPSGLREHAGLSREVVLIGVNDRAEIWDKEAWDNYRGHLKTDYEEIAEKLER